MTAASVMAESTEAGAPIAKDTLDPELIKLARTQTRIGVITAAGLVFLAVLFLVRLSPDRRFAGEGDAERVAVADVAAGKIGVDRFVEVANVEPMISQAVRATVAKGTLGTRLVPVRTTAGRLWLAVTGDGWDPPAGGAYKGRLRKLASLPYAGAVDAYVAAHPQPVFAKAADLARATDSIDTVGGDKALLGAATKLGYDVTVPNESVVVGTLGERFPSAGAWGEALGSADVAVAGAPDVSIESARFHVHADPAALNQKLEHANLWGARVEPVTEHREVAWSQLRGHAEQLAGVDLVGVYATGAVPSDAYVLLTEEKPADYWYVLPITIALVAVGLLFAWALVRAVKRDVLAT